MPWFERSAEPYLPYLSHITPEVVLLADGSLLAALQLHGIAHELSIEDERRVTAQVINGIWHAIGDDNVTLGTHYVRRQQTMRLERPRFGNEFSEALDANYRERVLGERLFVNEWFVSIIVAPPNPFGGTEIGRQINRRLAWFRNAEDTPPPERLLSQLRAAVVAIEHGLGAYHIRRLGLRHGKYAWFSEIAELLRLLLTTVPMSVPVTLGPLGHAVYTDRVVFGHYLTQVLKYIVGDVGGCPRWAYEVQTAAGSRFGAVLGLKQYMSETEVGILDALLSVPFSVVATQSFGFLSRSMAISKMDLKANQMGAAGDKARSQAEELSGKPVNADGSPRPNAQDRLMNGDFDMGSHHFSLAVYADNLADLDDHVGIARARLAEAGAIAVPETLGMEAAYWAQLPGNLDWRTRPAVVSSINFSHLADFPAFPTGSPTGRWGPAAVRFKTTAGTSYDYIPHVDDVGMTAIFGRTGSGKSTLLTFLVAAFDQYIVDRNGIIVFFDKDRGAEITITAMGGSYLEVRSGEASGLAPLRGFENTPYARDCLARWVRALIETDGHGPLQPADEARIARGVAAIMRLPVEMRSLLGLRQFLGWKDQLGAGARLERWCRGSALGWAFDGEDDLVRFDARVVGIGFTTILEIPEIMEPAAQYVRYRLRPMIDGRRVVIFMDEANAHLPSAALESEIKDDLLTLRKNNGIVILSAQQPEDMLRRAIGPTILGQCHTMMFFPTPTADEGVYLESAGGPLKLTVGELRAIQRGMLPGSRRILIKRRGAAEESAVVDFDLSAMPEFISILSGRANTVRLAERLRDQRGADWVFDWLKTRAYEKATD
jgi:type IV secretion system protein VirB4